MFISDNKTITARPVLQAQQTADGVQYVLCDGGRLRVLRLCDTPQEKDLGFGVYGEMCGNEFYTVREEEIQSETVTF